MEGTTPPSEEMNEIVYHNYEIIMPYSWYNICDVIDEVFGFFGTICICLDMNRLNDIVRVDDSLLVRI